METELAKRIGTAARKARTARGESQADVAENVGISHEFYARIERGKTMPSVPTLVKLATALEVSVDSLVGSRSAAQPRVTSREAETPDVRRLVRRVRQAKPRSVRLLNLVAIALDGPRAR
jgi:transcriptional regulator with XRE-family HTH domain